MNETKLKYFLYAAKTLSFTCAASACHVSQSTISKQVYALEEELKTPLFHRNNTQLALTAAGERLAARAGEYIEQYRAIDRSIRSVTSEPAQRLTVAAGTWEHTLLYKPLAVFSARHPDVEINCEYREYKDILPGLIDGTIDAAVCPDMCVSSLNAASKVTFKSEWLVAANEDHVFWHMPPEERGLLKDQQIISLAHDERELLRPYCLKNNTRHKGFVICGHYQSLEAMLRAGLGIALVPGFIEAYENLRLQNFLTPPLTVEYAAVCSHKSCGMAEEFIELFKQ